MSNVYDDDRVHPMTSAADGSYEVETEDGGWAVIPEAGSWRAASYSRIQGQFADLGGFETREAAIEAVIERY